MSRDVRDLLTAAAARPSEEVDVEALRRRGVRLRRRRRLGTVAAAATLAVAVAVPVGLGGSPSVIDFAPSPGTDSTPPPADSQPRSQHAVGLTVGPWERVGEDSLGVEGVFEGMAGGTVTRGGAVVAVGTSKPPEGRQRAAVWRSEDLRAWRRIDVDAFGGDTDAQLNAATSTGGDGVVAVGALGPQRAAPGTAGRRIEADPAALTAAAWRSLDGGRTWQTVAADRIESAEGAQMSDVAAGPRGLLAVGVAAGGASARPVVWHAPATEDDWRLLHTDLPAEPGTAYGPLASDGQRYVVAVEEPADEEAPERETSDQDVALWWSDDGRSWQPVRDPEGALTGPGDQRVADLLVVDGTFLAIGRESSRALPQGRDVVWSSADGRRWRRAAEDLDVPLAATDFVTVDGHLVALTVVTSYATETLIEADPSVWTAPFALTREEPDRQQSDES